MVAPRNRASGDGDASSRAGSSNSSQAESNPPLVIVSERGRHSEASRRLVRAQAARVSAAQSRETRARNREDRNQREAAQAADEHQPPSFYAAAPGQHLAGPANSQLGIGLRPLVAWATDVLNLTATNSLAVGAAALAATRRVALSNTSSAMRDSSNLLHEGGFALQEAQLPASDFASRQLPIALPRGFVTLRQRIQLSEEFWVVISRTACFDFGSPGVEGRLHELLFDLVIGMAAAASLGVMPQPAHPIKDHLRIACTCLTIFQGQRADGRQFAGDPRYNIGLQAAWTEAVSLDPNLLLEAKSAEVGLWAIFIISVTTGAGPDFFFLALQRLWQDLQLRAWEEVRSVLLEFVYPGSFLDDPCQSFYKSFCDRQEVRREEMEEMLGIPSPD